MKILLTLFVLFFSPSVFADDISDFQIDGISIGDSLLDYFEKNEILNNRVNYYNNKTYTPVELNYSLGTTYDRLQFDYKTNDKKFIISSLHGTLITKELEECNRIKDKILGNIQSILNNLTFYEDESNLSMDPSGKYYMYYARFENGDIINVTCYDYSTKSGYQDHLSVTLKTKEFNEFLLTAYN